MTARENPFATCRVETLGFQLAGVTWGQLQARFAACGGRAALVGPHGSGKTTLAEALGRSWETDGWRVRWVRLSTDEPALTAAHWQGVLAELTRRDRVVLDGAEQLSWWAWRRFVGRTRAADGVLITAHRAGRWPTLYHCRTSVALFRALVGQLVDGQTDSVRRELGATWMADLYLRHRGNLREALRELYDRWGVAAGSGVGGS